MAHEFQHKNPARLDWRLGYIFASSVAHNCRRLKSLQSTRVKRTHWTVSRKEYFFSKKKHPLFFFFFKDKMLLNKSIIPDEAVFADFRKQCLSTDNWVNKYDSNGMQVWVEIPANKGNQGSKVHNIKCKMIIKDVSAATMYDVLHDGQYRKEWDPAMLESFDIARLSANADVGYYSWLCPKPIKNRDVVSLRSWQVMDDEYIIINFSVKHPKYPPRSNLVRAVSILTGYLIKPLGPNSCSFTYLSQADPKGSLPKVVVNKASQILAPRVMQSVHKAGQNYPEWKQKHSPDLKPWLYPEQNTLPMMDPAELSIQRADSLENVDAQNSEDSS